MKSEVSTSDPCPEIPEHFVDEVASGTSSGILNMAANSAVQPAKRSVIANP